MHVICIFKMQQRQQQCSFSQASRNTKTTERFLIAFLLDYEICSLQQLTTAKSLLQTSVLSRL